MEHTKMNKCYQECWAALFPNTALPPSVDILIRSISRTGQRLLKENKVLRKRNSFISVIPKENPAIKKLKTFRNQMRNFNTQLYSLCTKLEIEYPDTVYLDQLWGIFNSIGRELERWRGDDLDLKIAYDNAVYPFTNERQMHKFHLPEVVWNTTAVIEQYRSAKNRSN